MDRTPAGEVTTRIAGPEDLGQLVPLFDAYRVFYGQASDRGRAHAFLRERMDRAESILLLASHADAGAVGFAQLYPSFTSVGTARIQVLNDLFVASSARGRGVARMLLRRAEQVARERGAIRLVLSTARDNAPAQALYVAEGWVRDEEFVEFTKGLAA